MCGIIGYLNKRAGVEAPVGEIARQMLIALGRRGPDSAGIAIYDGMREDALLARLAVPASITPDTARAALTAAVGRFGALREAPAVSHPSADAPRAGERGGAEEEFYEVDLAFAPTSDLRGLERSLERAAPGAEVLCIGRRLRLMKQVGAATGLEAAYHLSSQRGSHFVGHTRMATESRVDLSHSQPFWAHGSLDLAVVHNGHITNYHLLRRRYEQAGHRFYTENDSEVIGLYLADLMEREGISLPAAMERSLDDLDGSFSYVVGNAEGIGYAKDRFGLKPLLLAETEEFVGLATEAIALEAAFGEVSARELPTGTSRFWGQP